MENYLPKTMDFYLPKSMDFSLPFTFASNFFIDEDLYKDFVEKEDYTKEAIVQFSESLAIHPSILLGRLQKDDKVNYSYLYELKTKYLVNKNYRNK